MTELAAPALWRRVAAGLRGEISAEALESFRRAGRSVYAAYLAADKTYADLARAGTHPWDAPPATAGQFLCTWNALVLQTLGEALLDADYAAHPTTAGYLPRVTAEQARIFFAQVEPWLSRARQAAASSSYRVEAEVALPVPLPPWLVVQSSPAPHVHATLAAGRALGERLEAAFGTLASAGPTPAGTEQLADRIRGLAAGAQTDIGYAATLHDPDTSEEIHQVIEAHLHRGLQTQFLLGQALAMPHLVERVRKVARLDSQIELPAGWAPTKGVHPWSAPDPQARARLSSPSPAGGATHRTLRPASTPGGPVSRPRPAVMTPGQVPMTFCWRPSGRARQ